jgi:hypothetical protein
MSARYDEKASVRQEYHEYDRDTQRHREYSEQGSANTSYYDKRDNWSDRESIRMLRTPLDGIPLFSSRHQAGEQKTSMLMGKLAKLQTGEAKENIHILEDGSINAMTIQSLPLPNPLLSNPPPIAISNPGTMSNGITSTLYLYLWAILPMEMQLGIGRNAITKSIVGK